MIRLDQKAEILMKYFRENKSQRTISRELGISRTTVQKYIKEFESKNEALRELKKDEDHNKAEILLLIEEMASKPKYDTSKRTKIKLTDDVLKEIDELVSENEKNRLMGRTKQLMKKIDIHEELVERGYDIGYTTVCNYIKETYEKKEAYIRQEYDLGETLEFDWGEVKLTIDGRETTLNMGLFTTAKGSYHYAKLYQNQKMENFLDIHVKAFNQIGGVHREVVYDNMKQAVKRFVGRNEKEATEDLIKISLYYGFRYRFCNIASGNEKGHVERGIEFVRRKAFSNKMDFDSIEDANQHLEERLLKLNSKKRNWLENRSPIDLLNDEMDYLIPLKPSYDTARRIEARVNKYSIINIDQNKYSVPDYLVGKFVTAKIYPENIEVYYKDKLIATHLRSYSSHHWTVDINHFIHTLKKKPGALHSSVGRHQLSPELQQIYHKYYINNPRDFIVLLELIKEKDLESVLKAVKELEKIKKEMVNTDNIRNIVFRAPTVDKPLETKDTSIQKASLEQISILSDLFNLKSVGGYKN
ncbi:IS21 family transposase [Schnuerera sp.]|uniref:IS21 family transposase n=1 Tax=Schnuerera sp. TaxID=2794844 RepID=UPI002CD8592A|nr:IS21 family transposase [Schnuerera sp.]HSH36459.1 IS21 family transposase [Schnuerera sp.]